ncbi:MAG: branched-chain amino acid ABC transporter permease [Eubacteriales bacterium]|nr:branched-chain amino acid ABC transporter permease [Eubacteriales bacterium]
MEKTFKYFKAHKDFSLTVLMVVIISIMPLILSNDYFIHIGCMIGINILLALGMHLVTGLAGQINMGQYGFYCIGAYSGAVLTTGLGLPFWPGLLGAIVITACFGLLIGIPSLKVEGPYLALCTIGFAESARLIINSAGWAGKANGIMRIPKLSIFGMEMRSKLQCYIFIMCFAVIGVILVNNLMRSNYGRRYTAIKDDPLAASVIGINVRNVKLMAFVLCAAFAGVAGCLYANYSGYIQPTTFIQALQTNFLLMIVLGGLGSSWGAVLGAVMITVIYEYTRSYVQYQKIAFGIIMILIVLFLQRGIVGTVAHYRQLRMIREQHKMESQSGQEGR